MSEEVIHPPRRRMIEDMTARNLDEGTQRGYLRAVRSCSRYRGRGPGQLTFEDVRRFQLHLMESGPAGFGGWRRHRLNTVVGVEARHQGRLGKPCAQ